MRRLDWALIAFFGIAFLIAWGMIPLLAGIARESGLPDWLTLSRMGEALDFGATDLAGTVQTLTFTGQTLVQILFSPEAGLLVAFFLRGAMGEEPGLRGFALPRLESRMSPFYASLIISVLWAAWHLPALLYQNAVSIVAFLLPALLLSFVFTWLFNGSGGSLIPGMILHATQNSEEIFEVLFPGLLGTDWELMSSLALLVVSGIIAFFVWRQSHP
jgi:membrane protease YdiL (CAAX protease family)